MMLRRLLVLDLLLIAILIAGGMKVRRSWVDFKAVHRVDTVQAEPEAVGSIAAPAVSSAVLGDWTEIPTKNPFSFDRNDIGIVAPKEAPKAVSPKPILFGTMSVGKDWIALLAPGPGGRSSRPMKVGETMESWQVAEIHEKSVVVVAGGVRETILLNDPTANIPRVSERTAGGANPAAAVSNIPPAPPVAAAQTNTPTPPASPPPAAPGSQTGPGGQKGRWVETPFGRNWVVDPQ
jgi:hypothetical protein